MKRHILSTVLILLALASCQKQELERPENADGIEGEEVMMNFAFSAAEETYFYDGPAPTKSIEAHGVTVDQGDTTPDGTYIKDVLLIEYDNNGNKLGTIRYYKLNGSQSSYSLPVIRPTVGSGLTYKMVVIANTHDQALAQVMEVDEISGTLDNLKKYCRTVNKMEGIWKKPTEGTTYDITLSGTIDITETATPSTILECQLYRNVAQFVLYIYVKNNISVVIDKVQLCNISNRIPYADCLYGVGWDLDNIHDVDVAPRSWYDDDIADIGAINNTTQKPGYNRYPVTTYLAPRNACGRIEAKNDPTLTRAKNEGAPGNATHFKIYAHNSATNDPIIYTIYPGLNNYNDYNIVSNNSYVVTLFINTANASEFDSRVEQTAVENLPIGSNCFIINPSPNAYQKTYKLPITQLYKYWEQYNPDTFDVVSWQAEVIWQDKVNQTAGTNGWQIEFVDHPSGTEYGRRLENGLKYESYHMGYVCFKPMPGASGNVLIGVKAPGSEKYMWSWHLWLTDYDPYLNAAPQEGQYKYSKGDMHGSIFRINNSAFNGGIYADSFFMDRNVGAWTAGFDQYVGNYHFEFGRKDPFPIHSMALYCPTVSGATRGTSRCFFAGPRGGRYIATSEEDIRIKAKTNGMVAGNYNSAGEHFDGNIDGGAVESYAPDVMDRVASYKSMDWAVQYPQTYIISSGGISWTTDYVRTDILWKDEKVKVADHGKSLFDPCPPGWKIPEICAFEGLTAANSLYQNYVDHGFGGRWFNLENPSVPPTVPENEQAIYFPAHGFRYSTMGQAYDIGTQGFYYAADVYSGNSGRVFYFYKDDIVGTSSYGMAGGFSIRCISEPRNIITGN